LFFKHPKQGVKPPGFKKVKKYKSFTLKQSGYKFLGGNRVKIGKRVFQFFKSREIEGKIKTVTIKRTPLGELLLVVVTDPVDEPAIKFETGKTAGFDFGLKTFLTCSEGFKIASPQFFKQSIHAIQKANRELSRKVKGSHNREQARLNLCRKHEDIANRRRDWFWKLAHWLTNQFDVLYFEALNLQGMQRLWGKKVSDLAFSEFLSILEWVAQKKGKQVIYRDPWFPSSKMCSHCGHILDDLDLRVREWRCPECHTLHDRDENAAKNIKMGGSPSIGLGDVRLARPAISA
jgi:putative transposase